MDTAPETVQLRPIVRTVTRDTIDGYEEILGIGNPLHFDEEFARETRFGGIIAHGMMSLAYVSEMMAEAFGAGWYESGELDTTFVRPVRPGDTITTWGTAEGRTEVEGLIRVVCEVYCENQMGEIVLKGTATARAAAPITGVPALPA
jgi:3-hydroxybutyryl-CoA dehydratase